MKMVSFWGSQRIGNLTNTFEDFLGGKLNKNRKVLFLIRERKGAERN